MDVTAAIDRVNELLNAASTETANTSMRIPVPLRDAAAVAVRELGLAPSTTALTTAALRTMLEAAVMQAALQEHYRRYPDARPTLGDVAVAAASLDRHPLAQEPELLHQAADEISRCHPGASAEDVLLWAEARGWPAA